MRRLYLGFFFVCAAGVFAQEQLPATAQVDDVRLMADQITTAGGAMSLKGDVRVSLNGVTVYADEARSTWSRETCGRKVTCGFECGKSGAGRSRTTARRIRRCGCPTARGRASEPVTMRGGAARPAIIALLALRSIGRGDVVRIG